MLWLIVSGEINVSVFVPSLNRAVKVVLFTFFADTTRSVIIKLPPGGHDAIVVVPAPLIVVALNNPCAKNALLVTKVLSPSYGRHLSMVSEWSTSPLGPPIGQNFQAIRIEF